jgi:uncharacterized membrane protein
MTTPDWALALLYFLHLLATVVWVGSLAALTLLIAPAAKSALSAENYAKLLENLQERLQRLGWLCLGVLVVTGMFQMSAHPRYGGFLAINNPWAAAILLKHLVIGGMVLLSIYQTWGLMPQLKRLARLRAAGKLSDTAQQARLQKRETLLLRANLVIAALVLLFTAWARIS